MALDAENRALAEGANWGDEQTKLETALRAINGVATILLDLGSSGSPSQLERDAVAYLGDQLWDHEREVHAAFEKLLALHHVEQLDQSQKTKLDAS